MTLCPKYVFLVVLLSFVKCAPPTSQSSQVKAPDIVGDSFVIDSSSKGLSKQKVYTNKVGIRKSSLDKEFLLQGSLITQHTVATFNNLKSRVVAFKQVDDELYMLEATQGHKVGNVFSQSLVLAKLPIVEETNEIVYFDFAAGMSHIFVASDWYSHDSDGSEYQSDSWDSVAIDVSYIESAEMNEHNHLVIRQIAQLKRSILGLDKKKPVEVKYYLTPYKPNPKFLPTKKQNFDNMGFFEIAPQLTEGGDTVIYASKFDHRKGITFALSANVPLDYRQAVRDGILYWNKAFGYEAIKVVDAPKGLTAPDFNYNIVQWVDWDDAGFAYADAQMDPRSGEILHAQVFLTSVFAFSGRKRAKILLSKLLEEVKHSKKGNHDHHQGKLALRGFEKESLCDFHPQESMISGLTALINAEVETNDEIFLKVSQDYVREVVAHEIGHTLGLRHNFAGSLHANFPQSAKAGIFREYLLNGEAPVGVVASSSVMEYQRFMEAAITGDQIVNYPLALDYDTKAVQFLYDRVVFDRDTMPLFCTDSHVNKFADCSRFTSGESIFEYNVWKEEKTKKDLPYLLLERFIAAKALVQDNKIQSIGEATPSPTDFALSHLSGRRKILASLEGVSAFLQVRRTFPYINDLNKLDVLELEDEYVVKSIKQAGGLKKILSMMDFKYIDQAQEKFAQLLEEYESNPEVEILNDNDISVIKKESAKFFKALPLSYILADLKIFEDMNTIIDSSMAKELALMLTIRASMVILMTHKTITFDDNVNDEIVTRKLPIFTFPPSVRIRAANLLRSKDKDVLWGVREKKEIKNILLKSLNQALGEDVLEVEAITYSDRVARWILENKKVLLALN